MVHPVSDQAGKWFRMQILWPSWEVCNFYNTELSSFLWKLLPCFSDSEYQNGPIISLRFGGIIRRPVESYRFPTIQEVDRILSMPDYDFPPYDETAGSTTFRNCFEGNCPEPGQSFSIHNLVDYKLFLGSIFFYSLSWKTGLNWTNCMRWTD